MANTLSVMNFVRNVVSKKRRRFTKGGYNLDLAYICDNIIAMGYPADNIESIYRNRLEDVYKFLEENHYDHYKIYNLCLERSYDINKFHRRVAVYPFEDHNPPSIEQIQNFCDDVDSWLKADNLNVAAVHCKAGKGRTGTMICCYLLYSGQKCSAEDALACYDEKRTKDGKGVTIPSQRRYVQYFSKLIRSGLPYERRTLQFCEIRFTEAHVLLSQGTVNCSISELQDTGTAGKVQALQNLTIDFRKSFTLDIKNPTLCVAGDIKVELTQKISKKKIFHLWFNTFFVYDAAKIEGDGDDAKLVYTLNKCEIDDAHKDKEHKHFSEDFKVQLVFYADDSTARNQSSVSHRLNNHRTSQSAGLPQNTYSLPQNSSSGSDLNYICDYKSSSTASVSSLIGGAGAESGSFETYNRSLRSSAPNHAIYASACSNNCGERASYSDIQKHHNSVGNNVPQQQQSQTVLNTVTATSTPNSKHSAYAFTNNQRHQNQHQHQQQYQPSAGRDTNSNKNLNAQIIGSETPRLNHQSSCHGSDSKNNSNSNTSSKSSSISSHSSSSATADNEEDWESGESSVKPIAHNVLFLSSQLPSPPATHLSSIPASNLHKSCFSNFNRNSSSYCKNKIGGDNDVNDDDDDDDNYDNIKNNLILNLNGTDAASSVVPQSSTNTFIEKCYIAKIENNDLPKSNSVHTSDKQKQALVLSAAPTSRHKFMDLLMAPKNTSNTTQHKKPLFRRNSKSAHSSAGNKGSILALQTVDGANNFNCTGSSGLGTTSRQKLKIKLKNNKQKLSQKFQWFQSYFRSDPTDFCENFVQQTTAMRRNSTCSVNSRSHKTSVTTPPSSFSVKLCYPSTTCSLETVETVDTNDAKDATLNSNIKLSSPSTSVTASNASLSIGGDICDDYYSSICDNQLSSNNSPCKSPRSLVDIVMAGGSYSSSCARSASLSNTPAIRQHMQNELLGDKMALQSMNGYSGSASRRKVVVVARPAETHAIGFKVAETKTELQNISNIVLEDDKEQRQNPQNQNILKSNMTHTTNTSVVSDTLSTLNIPHVPNVHSVRNVLDTSDTNHVSNIIDTSDTNHVSNIIDTSETNHVSNIFDTFDTNHVSNIFETSANTSNTLDTPNTSNKPNTLYTPGTIEATENGYNSAATTASSIFCTSPKTFSKEEPYETHNIHFVYSKICNDIEKLSINHTTNPVHSLKSDNLSNNHIVGGTVLNLLILKKNNEHLEDAENTLHVEKIETHPEDTIKNVKKQDSRSRLDGDFFENDHETVCSSDVSSVLQNCNFTCALACNNSSGSSFCTSECCTNSSSSTCSCNPFAIDLERYAASRSAEKIQEKTEAPINFPISCVDNSSDNRNICANDVDDNVDVKDCTCNVQTAGSLKLEMEDSTSVNFLPASTSTSQAVSSKSAQNSLNTNKKFDNV
ncbi:dentin sialophosphoprotein isoform X2 [Teleopsis dalmanni]|uniref:dentin sialophosphoprotein isoform X2 n=1 Tax=Teleopsis dalmanni TaxID=139649 RepID=UPI0018CDBF28|nr:dentin sialophosphoprotein isoform X2 [Teleopsis dalmanni]